MTLFLLGVLIGTVATLVGCRIVMERDDALLMDAPGFEDPTTDFQQTMHFHRKSHLQSQAPLELVKEVKQ